MIIDNRQTTVGRINATCNQCMHTHNLTQHHYDISVQTGILHDCLTSMKLSILMRCPEICIYKSPLSPQCIFSSLWCKYRTRLCQVEAEWTYMRHVHQHHTYTMELGDWHVDHDIRLWLWLLFWFWWALASMATSFSTLFFCMWLQSRWGDNFLLRPNEHGRITVEYFKH